MFLQNLSLQHFKNYREASFEFCNQINCIVGRNGMGKTNILDAIYYMCYCKSYFTSTDSQNILHGESFFALLGNFNVEGKKEKIHCAVKKNQKKVFRRNDEEYERLAEHIGLLPSVIITPGDIALIYEGSVERRKFTDSIICMPDKRYLDDLLNYNRLVEQRNSQLRIFSESNRFDENLLDSFDQRLAALGESIYVKRKQFFEEFAPLFNRFYGIIAGTDEEVAIVYESQLATVPLLSLLKSSLRRDLALERTTAGIHKDDLLFTMGGHSLKKFASQGQQKSFLIALKLSQYEFLRQKTGTRPLLLLDDIFEKLDEQRTAKLLEMIADDSFGQIFITDTHLERLKKILEKLKITTRYFIIEGGNTSTFTE
jgi:DNA replication and repair protein RecF